MTATVPSSTLSSMPAPRRAFIIDDEARSRELLRRMLEDYCAGVTVVGEADGVASGIAGIRAARPDLVFLDVELRDGDGFEVLEAVDLPAFEVVMVSGHSARRLRSFGFAALAYVSKPVILQEFQAVVAGLVGRPVVAEQVALAKEVQAAPEAPAQRLMVTDGSGVASIRLRDICFLEAQRSYTRIVLVNGGEHFAPYPLRHYEQLLPSEAFFRIHRSYLLNLALVEGYETGRAGRVHLENGLSLPLAARRKAEFVQQLKSAKETP